MEMLYCNEGEQTQLAFIIQSSFELSVASLSEAYAPAIIDNDGELRTLIAQANFESFDAPLEQ